MNITNHSPESETEENKSLTEPKDDGKYFSKIWKVHRELS